MSRASVSIASVASVAIVDLGLGNLGSVHKAVALAASRAGLEAPVVTPDPDVIARAERLVVPGQGAFRDGAAALAANGESMRQVLQSAIAAGKPYLGICLGLQLLLDESDEAPGARGLGVFSGRVERIASNLPDPFDPHHRTLKVPHMGWNQLARTASPGARAAADALDAAGDAPWFYFVHSFHARPLDADLVAATASYGSLALTAALARGPLLATQFHPEKSQVAGLALLEAFLRRKH